MTFAPSSVISGFSTKALPSFSASMIAVTLRYSLHNCFSHPTTLTTGIPYWDDDLRKPPKRRQPS